MTRNAKSAGLLPDYCFDLVREITVEFLASHNVEGILVDIDNTITRWENVTVPEPEMEWLGAVRAAGIDIRLLSNGLARKKSSVVVQTGIEMVSGRSLKPTRAAFRSGLKDLDLAPERVMMIGDSVFTDIMGANRVGIWTCLVEPLSPVDFIGSKAYRLLERLMNLRRPFLAEHDFRRQRRKS